MDIEEASWGAIVGGINDTVEVCVGVGGEVGICSWIVVDDRSDGAGNDGAVDRTADSTTFWDGFNWRRGSS